MMVKEWMKEKKSIGILFLISVFVFICTYPKIGGPTTVGLDPSYAFAYNYFFHHQIQLGKDIIFSFGPLGFLLFPQPIGHNLLIALIFISILRFLFICSFLYLLSLVHKDRSLLCTILSFLVLLISVHLLDLGYSLILFTAILLFIQKETGKMRYFYYAILVAVLALLIKSSFGILSLLVLASYSLIRSLQMKKVTLLLIAGGGILLVYSCAWLLLYGNFQGIFSYLYGTLQLSSGNSSAMTINPANHWSFIIAAVLLLVYLPFYLKNERVFLLYGLFILPLLAGWKYAFSRIDHINFFVFLLFFFLMLVLFLTTTRKWISVAAVMVAVLLLFNINTKLIGFEPINFPAKVLEKIDQPKDEYASYYFNFREYQPPFFYPLRFSEYQQTLITLSQENLASYLLDPRIFQIIGQETVDVYPWEASIIPANFLRWQPRPVFQSYIAYTPWLDRKNEQFFQSGQGPAFLIWEHANWGGEMGSIDERYLLNDEPLTIFQILKQYQVVYRDDRIVLLQRQDQPRLTEPEDVGSSIETWNEWIQVPDQESGFLRAKMHFSKSILSQLKRMVYKEHDFYIDYKLSNGEILSYRLVIDNAQSGVWINPLITSLGERGGEWETVEVVEIRVLLGENRFYKDEIEVEWEMFERTSN